MPVEEAVIVFYSRRSWQVGDSVPVADGRLVCDGEAVRLVYGGQVLRVGFRLFGSEWTLSADVKEAA